MKSLFKLLGLGAAGATLGTAGASVYFFNTIMKRATKDRERTMKMSGTDWGSYAPVFQAGREYISQFECQEVYVTSRDDLRLHGYFYPNGGSKKLIICFHGYTGDAETNFLGQAPFFLKHGYSLLMVDARTHGKSEGTYVGFGCLDRYDALKWMDFAIETIGSDVEIVLYGVSMGGATVLMTTGLDHPDNLKGVIADCPFTSAKEVFSHCLATMYHIPPAPILAVSEQMCRNLAGYGLDDCNSKIEVKKARVPILLIHGSEDTFVPASMTPIIANNCASTVSTLIIEGAAHAESYYKDTVRYEEKVEEFLEEII